MKTTERGKGRYTIGEAARLLNLHERTLRVYERARLIEPQRNLSGSQRLYSEQDLIWIGCIRHLLHNEGLTATAIRRLLDLQPCWAIKGCPAHVIAQCRPHLNIPGRNDAASREGKGVLRILLFYGVREFGAILPCFKCVRAEKVVRKVAQRFAGRVEVRKEEVVSAEAQRFGLMLAPSVVIGDRVITNGMVPSEALVEKTVRQLMTEAAA